MHEPGEDFFCRMCTHAGVALIATDADLRIRFWNASAGRIFGGSSETMLGQPLTSIVPFERRELGTRLFERALYRGEISEFEFPHRSPQGNPIYLAVTISPIFAEAGGTIGISIYVRDVTRRLDLQREIAETQKMSALGSMAGEVAHHFNNVIGGIMTSIDFVQNSDDPAELRRSLRATANALARANKLTRSLLAFAEGDPSDSLRGDPAETIRKFIATIEPRLRSQNIQLETDLQPVQALVPARRMLTILDRVTANAFEAMPEGGTLRFELAPASENQIVLRICDTGKGIFPENLPHVFEPFFTTKSIDGRDASPHAGLGLAVVHGIVKDLGGTITLASRPAGGTICSVCLPRQTQG
jgi:PAS domain S-box-containing protein